MLDGGRAAAAWHSTGFEPGARADLLVVNTEDDALCGQPESHLLDGLVFSAPQRPFSQVLSAGRWVAPPYEARRARFRQAMQALWAAA